MSGGVSFKHEGVIYLNLGFQLKENGEHTVGAAEIVAGEFEAARQQLLNQRTVA
ncbi:hypothetical protein [Pseudomonas sp. IT-P218]|uniref:hypothetical protein n=1 Tax=Pseudomonas sp. IT-P218 TaxID=3026449 RepID=UPI0039E06328